MWRRWLSQWLACVAILLATARAQSQDGFDVHQFHPVPSQSIGYFNLGTALVLEHGTWEVGLLGQYADDVLVLVDDADDRLVTLVGHQLTLDLIGAVGLFGVLELGADVPLVIAQSGDDATDAIGVDGSQAGFGLGDVRLVARAQLFSTEDLSSPVGVTLGLAADLTLPTGDEADFQGAPGVRFETRFLVDLAVRGGHRLTAQVGYRVRPKQQIVNLEVDDTLTFGFGTALRLAPAWRVLAELVGEASVLADSVDAEEVPLEVLVGAKALVGSGVWVIFGAGTGLNEGFGSPDYRVFIGAAVARDPYRDTDDDGVALELDRCPESPEDVDGWLDADGCPDPDNDGDWLADRVDDCPIEAEDADGWLDADGCPDPDNDGDGLQDVVDRCPFAAEDRDGWADEDGCPETDHDGDGVPDTDDACPNGAEVYNSVDDADGCPDALPLVEATCERIELRDAVYFDRGSDRIQPRSFELLEQVAMILAARADIRSLRVEAHTDDRGRAERNLDLSQRRAESVRAYLMALGIAGSRLSAVGYGESQPIADNSTAGGRAINRRVELIILGQEECDE